MDNISKRNENLSSSIFCASPGVSAFGNVLPPDELSPLLGARMGISMMISFAAGFSDRLSGGCI